MLQIRRGNRDNLGMVRNMFCDLSLEPSRRDGSNEGSQHVFPWEIGTIVFELSSILSLIWSSDGVYELSLYMCYR